MTDTEALPLNDLSNSIFIYTLTSVSL